MTFHDVASICSARPYRAVTTSTESFAAAALAACTAKAMSADDSDDRRLEKLLPRRQGLTLDDLSTQPEQVR